MTGQNSYLNIGNDQIYPILYNGKVWVVTTARYLENNDGRTDLVTRHLQVYPLLVFWEITREIVQCNSPFPQQAREMKREMLGFLYEVSSWCEVRMLR